MGVLHLLRTRTQPSLEIVEGKGGFDRLSLRLLAFKTNEMQVIAKLFGLTMVRHRV